MMDETSRITAQIWKGLHERIANRTAKTTLDLRVVAGEKFSEFNEKQSPHGGTGYKDVCDFANMNCPGAKNSKTFESICVNAKEQYDISKMHLCPYSCTSKGRGYLVQ